MLMRSEVWECAPCLNSMEEVRRVNAFVWSERNSSEMYLHTSTVLGAREYDLFCCCYASFYVVVHNLHLKYGGRERQKRKLSLTNDWVCSALWWPNINLI